jgi:hypothetical protein
VLYVLLMFVFLTPRVIKILLFLGIFKALVLGFLLSNPYRNPIYKMTVFAHNLHIPSHIFQMIPRLFIIPNTIQILHELLLHCIA